MPNIDAEGEQGSTGRLLRANLQTCRLTVTMFIIGHCDEHYRIIAVKCDVAELEDVMFGDLIRRSGEFANS